MVLLSAGADDPRSQPDPETLLALEGYTLLRTDRNGWIEVITDGEMMWVEVESGKTCLIIYLKHSVLVRGLLWNFLRRFPFLDN